MDARGEQMINPVSCSSEVLAMDKSGDHVGNGLAGPLWCHVAHTLDRDELKTVIGLSVA